MLKGVVLSTGLFSGLYLGIYLRQQGLDRDLKKAYYTFQGESERKQYHQQILQQQLEQEGTKFNDQQFQAYVNRAKVRNEPLDQVILEEQVRSITGGANK
jgi:hypothetical protein